MAGDRHDLEASTPKPHQTRGSGFTQTMDGTIGQVRRVAPLAEAIAESRCGDGPAVIVDQKSEAPDSVRSQEALQVLNDGDFETDGMVIAPILLREDQPEHTIAILMKVLPAKAHEVGSSLSGIKGKRNRELRHGAKWIGALMAFDLVNRP